MEIKKEQQMTYDFMVDAIQDGIELSNDLAVCLESSKIDTIGDKIECPTTDFVREVYNNANKIVEFDKMRSIMLPFITRKYSVYISPIYNPLMEALAHRYRGISKSVEIFQDKAEEYKQKIFPKIELQEDIDEISHFIDELDEQNLRDTKEYTKLIEQKELYVKKMEKLSEDPKIEMLEREIACIDPFFKVSSAIMSHINMKMELAKDILDHPNKLSGSVPESMALENALIDEYKEFLRDGFSSKDINKINECLISKDASYGSIIENSKKRSVFDIKSDFYTFAKELITTAKNLQKFLI